MVPGNGGAELISAVWEVSSIPSWVAAGRPTLTSHYISGRARTKGGGGLRAHAGGGGGLKQGEAQAVGGSSDFMDVTMTDIPVIPTADRLTPPPPPPGRA